MRRLGFNNHFPSENATGADHQFSDIRGGQSRSSGSSTGPCSDRIRALVNFTLPAPHCMSVLLSRIPHRSQTHTLCPPRTMQPKLTCWAHIGHNKIIIEWASPPTITRPTQHTVALRRPPFSQLLYIHQHI